MRKSVLAVIAFLLLLGVAIRVHSQARNAAQLSKDHIEIFGASLQLGMTKAVVEGKLSGAEIIKSDENSWLVTTGGLSTLHFDDGKLSFADRTWHSKENDIVDALYGAVTYFNNEGHSLCAFSADTIPDPQNSYERVWIRCGDKSILIAKTTIQGKTFEEVGEQLGVLKRDSK
jgi:hypothetical protein